MSINSYFDVVFCINLDRRVDRLARASAEAIRYGITFTRWPGVEVATNRKPLTPEHQAELATFGPTLEGCPADLRPYGTMGTTLAHRQLLRHVAEGPWARVLVLEDDFQVITPEMKPRWFGLTLLPDDFQDRFDYLAGCAPSDWDVLYLGGGYGRAPLARINVHCLRVDLMHTTSSYGITREYAKLWTGWMDERERNHKTYDGTPYSAHIGLIDHLISERAEEYNHYAVQPRLIVQAADYSDATQRSESYAGSMTDENHEGQV